MSNKGSGITLIYNEIYNEIDVMKITKSLKIKKFYEKKLPEKHQPKNTRRIFESACSNNDCWFTIEKMYLRN